jgi:hypothetical protein
MTDIVRPRADLLSKFNVSGTSPQDMRDLIVSVRGGYGAIAVTGGSTEQGSLSTTAAKLTAFAADSASSDQCTPAHGTDNITLTANGVWLAHFSATLVGDADTVKTFQIRCTGTGTVLGGSAQVLFDSVPSAADVQAFALITGALNGDVVDVTVAGDDTDQAVTVSEAMLAVVRIF